MRAGDEADRGGARVAPSPRAQSRVTRYEVDASWPKPFPIDGYSACWPALAVDGRDHVFLLNRQDVLEGDLNAGRLAPADRRARRGRQPWSTRGRPTLLDPRLHSCYVDRDTHIWIASAPSGMVQKYSRDGKALLFQIGKKGLLDSSDGTDKGKPLNSNAARFFMPSSLFVDPDNGDVYVSDGEGRNGTVHCRRRSPRHVPAPMAAGRHADSTLHDGLGRRLGLRVQPWASRIRSTTRWAPCQEHRGAVETYTPPGKRRRQGRRRSVGVDRALTDPAAMALRCQPNNSQIEIIDRASGKSFRPLAAAPGHFLRQFDQPHGLAVDSRGSITSPKIAARGSEVQRCHR